MLKIVGNFAAIMYRLENIGDELPLHAHIFSHASVVMAGEVEAFDDEGHTMPLKDGERVEFPAGRKHGIRAMTAGAVFINLMPLVA